MNTRRFDTTFVNDPLLVGFDRVFDRMNAMSAAAQSAAKYPPYNILKTGENAYLIEIAVAGFAEDEIDIEVHDGTLTVRGAHKETGDVDKYIHKGISSRDFERKFTLADTVEVEAAQIYCGLLQIRLLNIVPEEKKPRKIAIGAGKPKEFLTEKFVNIPS